MTDRNVVNGSVQLPPVAPPAMQTVKLLVDKVIDGSVRSREELVTVPEYVAAQWIAANPPEAVAAETPGPAPDEIQEQPRARSTKRKVE